MDDAIATKLDLFAAVTGWMDHQARKHELGENYAEERVNAMTNYELLRAISDALGDIKPPREPTREMIAAGERLYHATPTEDVWRAPRPTDLWKVMYDAD